MKQKKKTKREKRGYENSKRWDEKKENGKKENGNSERKRNEKDVSITVLQMSTNK
jgi:hypothetical protein